MENASKALLIAGGMLLAIIILTLLVSVGVSVKDITETQDKKQLTEQIQQFNKEYEAYNKTKMYGIDVITVVNKARDYNTRLDTDSEEYKINIIVQDKNRDEISVSYTDEFKTAIFKCTDIVYKEGRVSSMTFSQI